MKAMITIPAVFLVLFAVGPLPPPGALYGARATAITSAVFHCDVVADQRVAVFANQLSAEPSATWQPSLTRSISHIHFLIAEKEVRGITAGRIVALVANEDSIGYLAESEDPCEAMSQNAPLSFVELVSNGVLAVPAGQPKSEPRPARIGAARLIDLRPE